MASKSKRRISSADFVASLTASEKEAIRAAWAEGNFDQVQSAFFRTQSTSTKRKAERVLPLIAKLRDDCESLAKLHEFGPSKKTFAFGRAEEMRDFLKWLSRIEQDWQLRAGRSITTGRPSVDDLYVPVVRTVGAIARKRQIRVTSQGAFPIILEAIGTELRLKDWRLPNFRTLGRIINTM
ncbi:MAG: hypothetical protein C6Y20_02280 [Tagaea sp. CACIAM 22H2]|nr:hypothetical protein [Tagaea sp. CACIAM 22H2]